MRVARPRVRSVNLKFRSITSVWSGLKFFCSLRLLTATAIDLQHERGSLRGPTLTRFSAVTVRVFEVCEPTFGPGSIGVEDALVLEAAWCRPRLER